MPRYGEQTSELYAAPQTLDLKAERENKYLKTKFKNKNSENKIQKTKIQKSKFKRTKIKFCSEFLFFFDFLFFDFRIKQKTTQTQYFSVF